jgi:hypothetical protein
MKLELKIGFFMMAALVASCKGGGAEELADLSAADENEKKIEDYFENVDSSVRNRILAMNELNLPGATSGNTANDWVADLNSACNGLATYTRDASTGEIKKPTVDCKYVPDDKLDGMSPKFKCAFSTGAGKPRKLKVKYATSADGGGKEIVTGIVGTTMSRSLGFKADYYCPAIVKCTGCTQDPWSSDGQGKSSGPEASGQISTFEHAMIEIKLPGYKVTEPRDGARKPQGMEWDELKGVPASLAGDAADRVRIDREAYMLWINFIYHTDADAHNNRLVCEKIADPKSWPPACVASVGYAHDFGDAFFRFKLDRFNASPVFVKGGGFGFDNFMGRVKTMAGGCVGSLDKGEGAIKSAKFSNEARISFVKRAMAIPSQDLIDLFRFAGVNTTGTKSSPEEWAQAFQEKVKSVESWKGCDPYKERSSVLYP